MACQDGLSKGMWKAVGDGCGSAAMHDAVLDSICAVSCMVHFPSESLSQGHRIRRNQSTFKSGAKFLCVVLGEEEQRETGAAVRRKPVECKRNKQ